MKRVWNLYRVSTDKQHDGEDIPLQRKSCNSFIDSKKDWKLTNEVYEMGVSGYKLTAKERDEIEYILKAAENKEFDVLLVFMFDRIGRREDDTPIIVQTLCKLGIEVWSVKEGERRFDNHVDKLINYITFWQANGESDKTSKRVTDSLQQLNEDGYHTGGTAPYGYEVYDTGIPHPKYDKTIKKLRINEKEAVLVRLIFNLVIKKGYGATRIAQWLNENKYKTRSGGAWRHNYISRILRNSIYIGYKQYNYYKEGRIDKESMKTQPFNELYVIIENKIFSSVQKIIDKNEEVKNKKNEYKNTPTKSALLLSGIVKCGYCGSNLKVDYSIKTYLRKDGKVTKMKTNRYVCGRGKDKTSPHGATQFGAKKYEKEVVRIITNELKKIDLNSFLSEKKKVVQKNTSLKQLALEQNQKNLHEATQELHAIESLLIKIEMGKSKIPLENAEGMLLEKNNEIGSIKKNIEELQDDINDDHGEEMIYKTIEDDLGDWDNKFDNADNDEKKMMLSRVIKSVIFKRDEIEIFLIDPLQLSNT